MARSTKDRAYLQMKANLPPSAQDPPRDGELGCSRRTDVSVAQENLISALSSRTPSTVSEMITALKEKVMRKEKCKEIRRPSLLLAIHQTVHNKCYSV